MPGPNRFAVALSGLISGAGAGGVIATIGALLIHVSPAQAGFEMFGIFSVVGAILAGIIGWRLTRPVLERWVRVVVTVLAVIGTILCALCNLPADAEFGLNGLIGLLLVELIAAVLASLWSRKLLGGSASPPPGAPATV